MLNLALTVEPVTLFICRRLRWAHADNPGATIYYHLLNLSR